MKVTIHNYKEAEAKIDWSTASKGLTDGRSLVANSLRFYDRSASVRTGIAKYLELLSETIKAGSTKTPAAGKTGTPARSKTNKKPDTTEAGQTAKKAKPSESAAPEAAAMVAHVPSDIALVRRFTNLHGKVKSHDQILSIWRAFEKAAIERKVNRKSAYQEEIAYMKESLTEALRAAKTKGPIELAIPMYKYKQLKKIADSVERSLGVSILLAFINISGRPQMQERAKKLQTRIKKSLETGKLSADIYLEEVKEVLQALDAYTSGQQTTIAVSDYALSGIGAVALHGCKCGPALQGFSKEQHALILKLRQEHAKNFSAAELRRVFADAVSPSLCLLIVQHLVKTRQLTLAMLRYPAKTKAGLGGVAPAKDSATPYNFNAEVMDMRLRSAGRRIPLPVQSFDNSGLSGTTEAFAGPDEEAKIIAAQDLVKMEFETIGLKGKYEALIGDPEPGFSMMIFGKPKQGKSTVAIDLAKELTTLGKTLYAAFEEQGHTLRSKVVRNKANVPGLDFANKLPTDLTPYRYVFIDSVTDAGLSEQVFKMLIKTCKPKGIAVIGVFHATKEGQFRGGQTFAHDVDIILRVADGKVYAQGRYAPPVEIPVDQLLDQPLRTAA